MLFHFCCLVLLSFVEYTYEISCISDNNREVDWFISYKLPKLEHNNLGGESYAVINNARTGRWTLSAQKITSNSSILGKNLASLYKNKKNLTYLIYNDDPPGNTTETSVGHLKGVLIFDKNSGIWLIHSIPNFPEENNYVYPDSGLLNGQSIICVTFRTKTLNDIAKQLLYNHPNIYAYNLSDEVGELLNEDAKSLFSKKPNFVRKPPFTRETVFKSMGSKSFTSFAKDNQFDDDLYSAVIAPTLKTPLAVETWRRGSGTVSPPACQTNYSVNDVLAINMTVTVRRNKVHIGFRSTSDHSKWAISNNKNGYWVCIGDINRMESQKKRGGGAICLRSAPTWRAFNSIVAQIDQCRI